MLAGEECPTDQIMVRSERCSDDDGIATGSLDYRLGITCDVDIRILLACLRQARLTDVGDLHDAAAFLRREVACVVRPPCSEADNADSNAAVHPTLLTPSSCIAGFSEAV